MGTWLDTSTLVTNLRNFKNSRGFVVGVLKSFLAEQQHLHHRVHRTV